MKTAKGSLKVAAGKNTVEVSRSNSGAADKEKVMVSRGDIIQVRSKWLHIRLSCNTGVEQMGADKEKQKVSKGEVIQGGSKCLQIKIR